MCTGSSHVEETKPTTTKATTAVTAATTVTPSISDYTGYTIYKLDNDILTYVSNYSFDPYLTTNQVVYEFKNGSPIRMRVLNGKYKGVENNDIIFKQDFMKKPQFTVKKLDVNFKVLEENSATDIKTAIDMIEASLKIQQAWYIFDNGVPIKKRREGHNVENVEKTDKIFTVTNKKDEYTIKEYYNNMAVHSREFDEKVFTNENDAKEIVNSRNIGPDRGFRYMFKNGVPVLKRQEGIFNDAVPVEPNDPIFAKIAPKVDEYKVDEYDSSLRVHTRAFTGKVLTESEAIRLVNERDIDGGKQFRYMFKNGVPVLKRENGTAKAVAVVPNDKIFETLNVAKPEPTVAAQTIPAMTIQELLKAAEEKHSSKDSMQPQAFIDLFNQEWPGKYTEIQKEHSGDTSYRNIVRMLAAWNPPAKPKPVERKKVNIHRKQHDFIVSMAKLLLDGYDYIGKINRAGNNMGILVSDWSQDIEVVVKKSVNPTWHTSDTHAIFGKFDNIDLVISD